VEKNEKRAKERRLMMRRSGEKGGKKG